MSEEATTVDTGVTSTESSTNDIQSSTESIESSTNGVESSTPTWQSPITATEDGKVILDGEEADFTYAELKSLRDLRRAAHQKIEDANKRLAEAQQKYQDPAQVREQARKEYEAELIAQWEEQQRLQGMDDRDKTIYQLQREKAEWERRQVEAEQARQAETQRAEDIKIAQQIESEFIQAMEEKIVPKNYQYLKRMTEQQRTAYNNGIDLPRSEIAAAALNEASDEFRETVKFYESHPAKLLEFIGEEALRSIRRADLGQLKAKGLPAVANPAAPKAKEAEAETQRDPNEHWDGGWGWMR